MKNQEIEKEHSGVVKFTLKEMPTIEGNLMHCAIGVRGEIDEMKFSFSNKNLIEEFGDILYYLKGIRQVLNEKEDSIIGNVEKTIQHRMAELFNLIDHNANQLLDLCKKKWAYGKAVDLDQIRYYQEWTFVYVVQLMNVMGIDYYKVLKENSVKLMKRYPEGYKDKAAIERADKQ